MKFPVRIDEPPRNGACIGHDVRMWFPHAEKLPGSQFAQNYKIATEHTVIAKKICSECEAREQCLNYGLFHEMFGIWGGLTERERKTMRRRHGISIVPKDPMILIPANERKSPAKPRR